MEQPEKKRLAIVALIALAIGGAVGYGAVPTKVVEKEKIVEKRVVESDKSKDKERDKKVVTTTETRPDGTSITRREETSNTKVKEREETKVTDQKSVEKEKVTIKGTGVAVRLMVATRINSPIDGTPGTVLYGLGIDKEILGPMTLGVFGLTDKTLGLSAGWRF